MGAMQSSKRTEELAACALEAVVGALTVPDTLTLMMVFIILQELPSILQLTIVRHQQLVLVRKMVHITPLIVCRPSGTHRMYISLGATLNRWSI
jgi:hypothetical protein